MDTNIGEIPALPAQVEAVYNDGTTGAVNVVWEEITADMVAKAGTFTVNGTMEGTTLKAKATYRVKFVDQSKTLLNIQPPAAITELANGTAKTAAAPWVAWYDRTGYRCGKRECERDLGCQSRKL
ncbi:Ig-like domain-containing protein [Neobacillus niacini]|uniref:Ig-like domain-containing protein n=1 Tax=Neobacillus niacini TaxID=86668 RepID=UPI003B5898E3